MIGMMATTFRSCCRDEQQSKDEKKGKEKEEKKKIVENKNRAHLDIAWQIIME